ncbi:hypothetical protein ACFQ23_06565 [Schaalia naturae]|uniref:Pilus assembly protein TadE n=1 Tax=Schaalia naturae TaxID=635203 RepID=A0ABW2SP52_9ACTO
MGHDRRAHPRGGAHPDREGGEAVIEFIVLTVAVVVPVIYLVLALSSAQAGVFAAEAGAREAARVLAADPASTDIAREQVELVFADFGLPPPTEVEMECVPSGCSGPRARIRVRVSTTVPLPLVPAWVGDGGLLPVAATSETLIGGLRLDG